MTIGHEGSFVRALFFASPMFLVGFIGLRSRTLHDSFQVPSGTPCQDAQVLAYVPYVRRTLELTRPHDGDFGNRSELLRLCAQWDDAVQRHELTPIRPISYEDVPEERARGSIIRSKGRLVNFLLADAGEAFRSNRPRQAMDEILLAMRLSESLKYSNFTTVSQSAAEQKRAVALLEKHLELLRGEDKGRLREGLTALQHGRSDLEAMNKFSRAQYYDWVARMQEAQISIEDVHQAARVTARIAADPNSQTTLFFSKSAFMESPDEDGPLYLGQLRMAWGAEMSNQRGIRRLTEAL